MRIPAPRTDDEIKRVILFVILLFMLIMSLTACNGNYHARRIDHHMRKLRAKAPELIETNIVIRTDTVYLPDIQKDTVTVFKENVKDSIIFKDKTVVRYLIKHDTLELEVDCPDQIIKTDSVFVKDVVTVKESFIKKAASLWYLLVIGFVIGVLVVAILRR